MRVFKFGGASVKNADAVRNVLHILRMYPDDQIIVVVSAMDKTTNRLEEVVQSILARREEAFTQQCKEILAFHERIVTALFSDSQAPIYKFLEEEFQALRKKFDDPISAHFGFEYDQVVSLGEILSSKILAAFLEQEGLTSAWLDARKLVRTDAHFKEANIDWGTTENLIRSSLSEMPTVPCFVTQGFIGHTQEGDTTTLGREGSDYSAAIFAYALEAKDVTIWKDVPGMLNADPKYFQKTQLLSSISYREAIELSYFGASVIHPKTVKPLQNKGIPLHIKSFISPHEDGTIIQQAHQFDHLIPSFIVKKNQLLITISANDFSFINEDALAKIFERFYQNAIKINLMQNSALNFSTLVDSEKVDIEYLIEMFKPEFNCKYNENVELLTIRHYNAPILDELLRDKTILLEQRSRQTARFVYRP